MRARVPGRAGHAARNVACFLRMVRRERAPGCPNVGRITSAVGNFSAGVQAGGCYRPTPYSYGLNTPSWLRSSRSNSLVVPAHSLRDRRCPD